MDKLEEYWKFFDPEHHFNSIQAGIRTRASTWILAAFAAIAVLLKTDVNVTWLVDPPVLMGVICCMATIGLLLLWINDQLVYQQLLNSGFLISLKREFDDHELPPVRTLMMWSAEGTGMSRWMTFLYTIPMWGFFAFTVAAIFLRLRTGPNDSREQFIDLLLLVVFSVAELVVCIWVQLKKGDISASTRAALFGNPEFAGLFKGTSEQRRSGLQSVIARYQPRESGGTGDDTKPGPST